MRRGVTRAARTSGQVLNAPVEAATFDHRDKGQFTALYQWAGSVDKMVAHLRREGNPRSRECLYKWRNIHGLPVAHPGYRERFEAEEPPEPPDAARELLEYLKGRVVPDAPPPTAALVPGEYATCLVASDLHYPFTHAGAFEVFLGLASRILPTEIVLDGDVFDFAQIGRYTKDPDAHATMQADMDACRESILARITAASPFSTRRFIVGNHEEGRWKNYLFSKCPELASLRVLTMEALLGLTELGWVWQPYEYWITDELIVYHGDRHTSVLGGGSAMTARKEAIDMGCSGLTGHTHHAGAWFRRDRMGYRVWHEIGCLCDWRRMQAAGVTTRKTPTKVEDWALCCALVRYRPQHSAFRVELIPILEEPERTFCIYQDEEIVA